MKITVGQLRKIIKEEVSRHINETVSLETIKSRPASSSWFGVMSRDSDPSDLAAAWDDMVNAIAEGQTASKETAEKIASKYDIDWRGVRFHLAKLMNDPGVKSGSCPTGKDMLDAVKAYKAEREAAYAAHAAEMAKRPPQEFDPYRDSPKLPGGGRYVGD